MLEQFKAACYCIELTAGKEPGEQLSFGLGHGEIRIFENTPGFLTKRPFSKKQWQQLHSMTR